MGQTAWSLDTKIILFKADRKFERSSRAEEQKILNVLKRMDKNERDKTENEIFVRSEGDYRKILLYPDRRYKDMTGKQIYSLETYFDGEKGIVGARVEHTE